MRGPQNNPMHIHSLDALIAAAKDKTSGAPARVAIARCADAFVLEAALHAQREKLAEPVLIGDMARTREVAHALKADISGLQSIDVADDEAAVREAVSLLRQGQASLIMKGGVGTSTLLKAILDKSSGLPPQGILSHVAVFEEPRTRRLMLCTDSAVNIRPNMQRKVEIVRNALAVARALGLNAPRVAMLAATEKVNYPAMPATLDADLVSRMAAEGAFGTAHVAGPMALDVALSPQAAACKGVSGPVAGHADILVAPDIESGNMLYKALNTLLGLDIAGVVVGCPAPVVVPSRGDSVRSKLLSLALAVYLTKSLPNTLCPTAS